MMRGTARIMEDVHCSARRGRRWNPPMNPPFRVLCIAPVAPDLGASAFGPFELIHCGTRDEAATRLGGAAHDAVCIEARDAAALAAVASWPALSHAVLDTAVLVLSPDPDAVLAVQLLQLGVQDVLAPADGAGIGRALRLAIERKRLELAARKAYATDLATGLPNHAQLLEHMTHLVALREREPAPMALIALRIEGLAQVGVALGTESANVLRRKVAVRLRAGLRASDVVAALGSDAFAVLLAWIDAPEHAAQVAAKLAQSLSQPFSVAGRQMGVAVSVGLASYPDQGKDAGTLLRRALGQAASLATMGQAGIASPFDRGPGAAANDEH
jgi:diguanylate cyclase